MTIKITTMKNLQKIGGVLIGMMLSMTSLYAQDDCGSAVTVTDLSGTICTTSSPSSTNALGAGSCEEGTFDTWFQFTAQGPTADISVTSDVGGGGGFNPEFLVISGTPASTCAGFVQQACADANGNYNTLTLTGLTGLNVGETYWIVVSSGNNVTSGTLTVCVDNPAATSCTDNDDCSSPATITLNAVGGGAACVTDCNTGATAGPDFAGTNCYDLPNATVWYTFTTGATADNLDITLNSTDLSDPEFTVFTTANCSTFTIIDCQEGSGGAASSTGLTISPNTTYIIAVSDVTADEGNFDLCITQNAASGCTANEDCNTPQVLTLNPSGGGALCVTDCNTGATAGPDFAGNNCQDMPNPTVWFEITTAADAATLDIDLSSTAMSNPEFTVFSTSDCSLYTTIFCTEGSGGSASTTTLGIDANTTYIIAVSDASGDEGSFDLCITQNVDNSACNIDNTLAVTSTSMGSPLTGPFQAGEIVEFCYTINQFYTGLPSEPQGCNYLQGIVPTFGDCWDPVSFDANGMPVITTSLNTVGTITDVGGCTGPVFLQDPWCGCTGNPAGTWAWYPAGSVDYNLSQANSMGYTTGDDVGAGWFFTTSYSSLNGSCGVASTDPDQTYGDNNFPNCDNLGGWQVCFQLQVKSQAACGLGETDCSVSVKTFADGEIGVWNNIGCTADLPTTLNGTINCALPIELGALSGEYVNRAAQIDWTTITESNVSHFEIYHVTGYGKEVKVGEVKAHQNSLEEIDYSFVHQRPNPGTNYYSLRTVDMDGSVRNEGYVSINADFGTITYDYTAKQIVLNHVENVEIYTMDGTLLKTSHGEKRIPFDYQGIFLIKDMDSGVMQRIVTQSVK